MRKAEWIFYELTLLPDLLALGCFCKAHSFPYVLKITVTFLSEMAGVINIVMWLKPGWIMCHVDRGHHFSGQPVIMMDTIWADGYARHDCLRLQVHPPCLSSWMKRLWIMWGMGLAYTITPSVHVSDFIAAILSVRWQSVSALHPAHTANYFFFGSCPSLVSLSYFLMSCFSHLRHFYTIKFNLSWGNVHCTSPVYSLGVGAYCAVAWSREGAGLGTFFLFQIDNFCIFIVKEYASLKCCINIWLDFWKNKSTLIKKR